MREPGFYWVKKKYPEDRISPNWWVIAEYDRYDTGMWNLIADEDAFNDSDFKEIDERRIVREEATKKELIEQLTNSIKNELRERISRDNHIFE